MSTKKSGQEVRFFAQRTNWPYLISNRGQIDPFSFMQEDKCAMIHFCRFYNPISDIERQGGP